MKTIIRRFIYYYRKMPPSIKLLFVYISGIYVLRYSGIFDQIMHVFITEDLKNGQYPKFFKMFKYQYGYQISEYIKATLPQIQEIPVENNDYTEILNHLVQNHPEKIGVNIYGKLVIHCDAKVKTELFEHMQQVHQVRYASSPNDYFASIQATFNEVFGNYIRIERDRSNIVYNSELRYHYHKYLKTPVAEKFIKYQTDQYFQMLSWALIGVSCVTLVAIGLGYGHLPEIPSKPGI